MIRLLVVTLGLLCAVSAWAQNVVSLTNTADVTIQVRILDYANGQVRVQRPDTGMTYPPIPLESLNQSSQKIVLDWARARALRNARVFEGSVSRRQQLVNTEHLPAHTTSGQTINRAVEIKDYDGFYAVTLKNVSQINFADVRVEYVIFSSQQEAGARNRDAGQNQRMKAEMTIEKINSNQEITFDTKPVPLREVKLSKGVRWVETNRTRHAGSLSGIWIRVYKDKDLLYEYTMPEGLPNREEW